MAAHTSLLINPHSRLHEESRSQSRNLLFSAAALHNTLLALLTLRYLDISGHRFRFSNHHNRLGGNYHHLFLVHRSNRLLLYFRGHNLLWFRFRLYNLLFDNSLNHWFHRFLFFWWLDDVDVGLRRWARLRLLDEFQGSLSRRLNHVEGLNWLRSRLDAESLNWWRNSLDIKCLHSLGYLLNVQRLNRLRSSLDAITLCLRYHAT